MSFYPLISNEKQLRELDGWLITSIHKAVKLRSKLLKKWSYNRDNDFPFNVPRNLLADTFKAQEIYGKKLLQIPSFFTIYQALKKGVIDFGVGGVIASSSTDYDY
jgi:hypothetical protein